MPLAPRTGPLPVSRRYVLVPVSVLVVAVMFVLAMRMPRPVFMRVYVRVWMIVLMLILMVAMMQALARAWTARVFTEYQRFDGHRHRV